MDWLWIALLLQLAVAMPTQAIPLAMATSGYRVTLQNFSTNLWKNAEKHCQQLGGHLNGGKSPAGFNETTFFNDPPFPEEPEELFANLYSFENNKKFAQVNRNNNIVDTDRDLRRPQHICSVMSRTGNDVNLYAERCRSPQNKRYICEVHHGPIQPTLVCSNKRYYYHTISFSLQHATESCKRFDAQARPLQIQDTTDLHCARQLFLQPGMDVNSSTIPVYGTNNTNGCQFYSVDKNTTVYGTCNLWRPVICVAAYCPRRCDNTTEVCQKLSETVHQCVCKSGLARQLQNDTCLTHGQLLVLNGAVENLPTNVTVYMFDSNRSTWIFKAIHPVVLTNSTTLSSVTGSKLFIIATQDTGPTKYTVVFINPPFRAEAVALIKKLYRKASDCIFSPLQERKDPSWPVGSGLSQGTFLALSQDGEMIRTPPIPFRVCRVDGPATTPSPTTLSSEEATVITTAADSTPSDEPATSPPPTTRNEVEKRADKLHPASIVGFAIGAIAILVPCIALVAKCLTKKFSKADFQ